MDPPADLTFVVRSIIDGNLYVTLGTAGDDGVAWVCPVYFATDDYRTFYWVSAVDTTHSRNLAQRPMISMVVFDSHAPAYAGRAVYMTATAAELTGAALDRGLQVYPGAAKRGGSTVSLADVQPPSPYRLFAAMVSEHSTNCPRPSGEPCVPHGKAFDHRIVVRL